jgi:hypothetical protein
MLSTVFVDYDNIYLSLKRKSEEAAKRFAKDASTWLREIESGRLISPTNTTAPSATGRRVVMNRCYGNPVPRRNSTDNSTDMNSFPFVRHHFLRAGFEVIDCPPLTAQLKNSADIRMVMDVRDIMNHETYYDEFIILSGDADFTPVLHRLRAHARRTVIFANDHTAAPYTAICDGEVREADLIRLLVEGRLPGDVEAKPADLEAARSNTDFELLRREIIAQVVTAVRSAGQPLPLEALADRAVRALGHDRTVGAAWGGAGTFRDLLVQSLPESIRLSDQAPYYVYDAERRVSEPKIAPSRMIEASRPEPAQPAFERTLAPPPPRQQTLGDMLTPVQGLDPRLKAAQQLAQSQASAQQQPAAQSQRSVPERAPAYGHAQPEAPAPQVPAPRHQAPAAPQRTTDTTSIQQSIARIHEACQAPPLSPPEYRVLFEVMAQEINTNGMTGAKTLMNIGQRAQEHGIELRRDDVRFVLEVVSEPDPWFEQGASANLFASRFRNFVVARCRSQGLNLSADELDLIEAWFAAPAAQTQRAVAAPPTAYDSQPAQQHQHQQAGHAIASPQQAAPQMHDARQTGGWWSNADRAPAAPRPSYDTRAPQPADVSDVMADDFPRIVRTRLRG